MPPMLRPRGLAALLALLLVALTVTQLWAAPDQQGSTIRPVQKLWMSDKANGDAITVFPSAIKSVYIVFDYKDATDTQIQVRVINPKGETIYTETKKYSGAGRENLQMTSSDPLMDGAYVTNVYVGLQGNLFLSETNEWNVGVPAPTAIPQAAPPVATAPVGEKVAAANPAAPAAAGIAAPAANAPVAAAEGGVSMPMLLGAGLLILGLVVLVVWAVRGFMNAPKASS